jgi:hypothetical protein
VQVWNLKLFCQELKPNKDINDNENNQKLGYDFLPEPKPNNEPLMIWLLFATLVQNTMVVVCAFVLMGVLLI